jgi:hypothetical protein
MHWFLGCAILAVGCQGSLLRGGAEDNETTEVAEGGLQRLLSSKRCPTPNETCPVGQCESFYLREFAC